MNFKELALIKSEYKQKRLIVAGINSLLLRRNQRQ